MQPTEGMPRFTGGAVGFVGYEYVTRIEPTVKAAAQDELQRQAPDTVIFAMMSGRCGRCRRGCLGQGAGANQ